MKRGLKEQAEGHIQPTDDMIPSLSPKKFHPLELTTSILKLENFM